MWIFNTPTKRRIAACMMVVMAYQLVYPLKALALTTGPSQPEVQSFEPVGTTDMVDMFTGDFNYNIPLMDVEGYPINIAYHGGVNGEQEASWCGLGWNINPGVVNRTVRGVPDDFNGDSLVKSLHIKEEKNLRIGSAFGVEPVGVGEPILRLSLSLGGFVNISNYRGVSTGANFDAGVRVLGFASAGVNLGVGSQNGADIDYRAGVGFSSSQAVGGSEASGAISVNYNSGYNSRTALKDRSWSVSSSVNAGGRSMNGPSWGTTVPIALKNYVPVITNRSTMKSWSANIKLGTELAWCSIFGSISGMGSKLTYDEDGTRKSYGYLFAQNATDFDINDFTRDRDGSFNKTMNYLPPATQTYDVYSVNGQGTGGSFRPFRNDYGTVYDPAITSTSNQRSGGGEGTFLWLFSGGGNVDITNTDMTSGPWKSGYHQAFSGKAAAGSLYEPFYFKQAGELTRVDSSYFSSIGGFNPSAASLIKTIGRKRKNSEVRNPRASFVSFFDAKEASVPGVASSRKIYDYKNNPFPFGTVNSIDSFDRYETGSSLKRRGDNISELTQVQTDGRRYVYGIPAMNNVQKEMTFAVDGPSSSDDVAKGLVGYTPNYHDTKGNKSGTDQFYSGTTTPAFAHSYLLTSVLSTDYIDIKGDGPTDDDFGSYTKFNYGRKNKDYRWRSPIETNKAHYNKGFVTDPKDDRGSYMIGSREQWMLHSIETKNFVAEFYTSERKDARGVMDTITRPEDRGFNQAPYNGKPVDSGFSYKLDSIKLFNKHDRILNGANAIPVKTVFFNYDYSLCKKLPNNIFSKDTTGTLTDTTGKLTLKKIYFRYGNSDKSMISPYQFVYSSTNPNYSLADKDRWGVYKYNDPALVNYEFPFVKQADPNLNDEASAWSLTDVILPSGGSIKVFYEADDYAYVQDRRAHEMFMIEGVSNSPNYYQANRLYNNKQNPNLYFFFKRRRSAENSTMGFVKNYMPDDSLLAYTASTQLVSGKFEPIKGYAHITNIGICSNNDSFGYIRVEDRHPDKGDANMNPITYTALNVGRYNLPHVLFPGSDPNLDDMENILRGMTYSLGELFSMGENPIIRMLGESKAKEIDLDKSWMRMCSPGLKKRGGGQRVKTMLFYDNWATMAGGDAQSAAYGKHYDYTTSHTAYSRGDVRISSGVASYEPGIGAEENPFRNPSLYQAQKGSNFPPNDPVELFQELPIGESFYPTPVVGYSEVTVTSLGKNHARSSQGVDVHSFYTAKDYPVQFSTTGIEKNESKGSFSLKRQELTFKATQGYTIVLNDMHGKPKRTEHKVFMPVSNSYKMISYTAYKYNGGAGRLDNMVPVLEFDKTENQMRKTVRQLGVETDITFDSREKKEESQTESFAVNVNGSNILWALIPIPLGYPWTTDYTNLFNSATATKIIQQYGILKEVESYNEGAITTVRNEVFDPLTGQALLTSVDNEFKDREYTMNYPAYWTNRGMAPAYENQGYEASYPSASLEIFNGGVAMHLPEPLGYWPKLHIGDELLLVASINGGPIATYNAWVASMELNSGGFLVVPRNGSWSATAGSTASGVRVKVIRSGSRNQLQDVMQTFTGMSMPFLSNGLLSDTLKDVINIKGTDYSNVNNAPYPTSEPLNLMLNGMFGITRPVRDIVYHGDRRYAAVPGRRAGLFDVISMFGRTIYPGETQIPHFQTSLYTSHTMFKANYMRPKYIDDNNYVISRTITRWSPNGQELENKDAIGNFSTAQYGYNNQLPVAVGQNMRQFELLSDGFEDFGMTVPDQSWTHFTTSFLRNLFSTQAISQTKYRKNLRAELVGSDSIRVVATKAHTGNHSLLTGSVNLTLIPASNPGASSGHYDLTNQPSYDRLTLHGYSGKYIVSFWARPVSEPLNAGSYQMPIGLVTTHKAKSGIIDGWQQFEISIDANSPNIVLPANFYIDDLRVYPAKGNMKAYVYHPVNQKLMATLDENNYATLYEYDQEGNLVRTKKETSKGIATISESRSANPKRAN